MASIIRTGFIGVKETFGRYTQTLKPGLNLYFPFVQRVHKLNAQINQMDLKFNVRTKDDAISRLDLAVQYKLDEDNVQKAFYSLRNSEGQIKSYVENIIRSEVPKMSLNKLFEDNDELCGKVKHNLGAMLKGHGYTLIDTLITDIEPEKQVKDAMNRVLAMTL